LSQGPHPHRDPHSSPTRRSSDLILIDGGRVTSVESVSQTRPLPADKPELAAAHATAATLIGMQAVYLDAGSGAERPVSADVIRADWKSTRLNSSHVSISYAVFCL